MKLLLLLAAIVYMHVNNIEITHCIFKRSIDLWKKVQKRNRFLNNNNVLCVRTTDNDIDHQNILYSVPPPIRRNVRTEENQKTPAKAQIHKHQMNWPSSKW